MNMNLNKRVLEETADKQHQTREALYRIQRQIGETEEIGLSTLTTLHEQNGRIDNVAIQAGLVNGKLDKTKKLQDRFAAWSLNFGTHRAARKMSRKMRQVEKGLKKLEQREYARGQQEGEEKKGNPVSSAVSATDRSELFGSAKRSDQEDDDDFLEHNNITGSSKMTAIKSDGSSAPINDQDEHILREIEAEDEDINAGLDTLGKQVDNLLLIAESMGDEAVKHNGKLDELSDDISKATKKQTVANSQLQLFSSDRRKRRRGNTHRDEKAATIMTINHTPTVLLPRAILPPLRAV